MTRLKNQLLIATTILFCTGSFADSMVDQFSSLDTSEGYFWGEDTIYYYTNFTIIQDYQSNDPNERLSLKSLNQNDWLVITYTHDRYGKMTATQILIVPDEETAEMVRREGM